MCRKIKNDNQGIAMISVIILLGIVMLLAGSLMSVASLSYKMRNISQASKDNFYSAEGAVDEVQSIVQQMASMRLAEAKTSKTDFTTALCADILSLGANNEERAEALRLRLQATTQSNIKELTISNVSVTPDDSSVVLEDVYIEYEDSKGFATNIRTDIVVNAPTYTSTPEVPLGKYSMFVGSGADIQGAGGNPNPNANQYAQMIQEGDVYIGAQVSGNVMQDVALNIWGAINVVFEGDSVTINGDIKLDKHASLTFIGKDVEVRGKIILSEKSNLLIGTTTNLVAEDIIVDGHSVKSGACSQIPDGVGNSVYFPFKEDRKTIIPADTSMMEQSYIGQDKSNIYYFELTDGQYYKANVSSGGLYKTSGIGISNITFVSTPQVPQVVVNGKEYDAEFADIVNVNTLEFLKAFSSNRLSPKQYVENSLVDSEEDGYKVFKIVGDRQLATTSDTGYDWNEFKYEDPKTGVVTEFSNVSIELPTVQDNLHISGNMTALHIGLNNYKISLNNGDGYVGIFMSAEKVTYAVSEGYSEGRCILNTADKEYLKGYMDSLGKWHLNDRLTNWLETGGTEEKFYRFLMNNVFNGGTKVFYELEGGGGGGDSEGSGSSDNSTLNFIEIKDWTKQ